MAGSEEQALRLPGWVGHSHGNGPPAPAASPDPPTSLLVLRGGWASVCSLFGSQGKAWASHLGQYGIEQRLNEEKYPKSEKIEFKLRTERESPWTEPGLPGPGHGVWGLKTSSHLSGGREVGLALEMGGCLPPTSPTRCCRGRQRPAWRHWKQLERCQMWGHMC